jgi:biopolymer transport protein TolR|tara:strand:+ start:756 stop:1229 length:474 start_codon:yes stop_codon:yes gene_type:complete
MGATANLKNVKQSRRRHGRRSAPMSEINVTPFVDVMLVLLIIFMVAAPMLTVGVDVELPKSAADALESENEEPLTITITKDGEIILQTSTIPREELIARLRGVAAERTSNRIFLRADGAISYEVVMQIMGALNAGGFQDIGLVTDIGGPALNDVSDE